MRDINLENIDDEQVREALEAIKESISEDNAMIRGVWEYFDFEFDAAGTHERGHSLGFIPQDYMITYDTAGTSVNYTDGTEDSFSFTTTSAGILRVFIGRYGDRDVV